jgi:2-oxoglutarate ferredoxin oxidoreductase subunit gamma
MSIESESAPLEIRLSGFGGQGIILAGYILGKAAAIHDHRYATLVEAYGPEARGGACSVQVIVSEQPIHYPYLTHADILVTMSQEAYSRFAGELKPGGILLVDADMVKLDQVRSDIEVRAIPASRIAEQIGHKIVANIVMLGFLTAVTKAVSPDAIKKAVVASVPHSAIDLNLKAFDRGLQH